MIRLRMPAIIRSYVQALDYRESIHCPCSHTSPPLAGYCSVHTCSIELADRHVSVQMVAEAADISKGEAANTQAHMTKGTLVHTSAYSTSRNIAKYGSMYNTY